MWAWNGLPNWQLTAPICGWFGTNLKVPLAAVCLFSAGPLISLPGFITDTFLSFLLPTEWADRCFRRKLNAMPPVEVWYHGIPACKSGKLIFTVSSRRSHRPRLLQVSGFCWPGLCSRRHSWTGCELFIHFWWAAGLVSDHTRPGWQ